MNNLDHSDPDVERVLSFDFLRCTEHAALATLRWIGRGEKELADEAASDAIRGMFDLMDIRGEVVIGEGIKDEAPGLFKGERVGKWRENSTRFDIALDPIDGTTNLSKGLPNAISCLAAATRHNGTESLMDIPAFYMDKLAYSAEIRAAELADPHLPIDLNAPMSELLPVVANILSKDVRDVVVMVLDRPRNQQLIHDIRSAGAALRMIGDGDIAAALAPAMPQSGVDLYAGIGGSPEGVLSAAALRCLGGGMQARIWPRDDKELASLKAAGWEDQLDQVYDCRDLASGDEIVFCATGINTSPMLKGIKVRGGVATTSSVLMRVKSGTVRFLTTSHNLDKKTISLRSANGEMRLDTNPERKSSV